MEFRYLSRDVLQGFNKYKYSSVDTSPLSNYVMHPFWNWLVQFIPLWVAPNALTLGGFLLLVVQFLALIHYDPVYDTPVRGSSPDRPVVPPWVWLLCALCMFAAHQLDGLDGKQARRTRSSSPLGELFDHGLDSLASVLVPLSLYSLVAHWGMSRVSLLHLLLCVLCFFFATHWEKYLTGMLVLSWTYDISEITMTLLYVLTYWGGLQFWVDLVVPGLNWSIGYSTELFIYIMIWMWSIPMCLYNIHVSYREGTGRNYGLCEAVRPLLPILVECVLFMTWAHCSPSDVLATHPRLFLLTIGVLFSNITCRLMVSGMSGTRSPAFNALLAPLCIIVAAVLTLDLGSSECYMLALYALLVHAAHLHYGVCVVRQLADHLNIYVFSVTRPPTPATSVDCQAAAEDESCNIQMKVEGRDLSAVSPVNVSQPQIRRVFRF